MFVCGFDELGCFDYCVFLLLVFGLDSGVWLCVKLFVWWKFFRLLMLC